MKKYLLQTIILLCATVQVNAQDIFKNTYLGVHVTLFADFILSPESLESLNSPNYYMLNGEYLAPGETLPTQSFLINTISMGAEVRQNLIDFDENTALGVALPLTLGYGEITNNPFRSLAHVKGYGSLQLPLLLAIYKGLGSTYDTDKYSGFSCGLGVQYVKIGLVPERTYGENMYAGKTGFVTPVATLGVHFLTGDNVNELRVKYGFGFTPGAGKTLSLSIHTLLNY